MGHAGGLYKQFINKFSPSSEIVLDSERKTKLTSLIALILTCVSAPYFFIFHWLNLGLLGNLILPIDILLGGAILLNKKYKKEIFAKYLIVFVPTFGAIYYACVLGKSAGIQLLYFSIACIPLVTFESKQKIHMAIAFFGTVSASILLEVTHYNLFPRIQISLLYSTIIYCTILLVTFIILILSILFYYQSMMKAEKNLIDANHTLQNALVELKQKKRMDAELTVAKTIQFNLLPKTCPQPKGIHIDAFMQPAFEVGGDYYDFFEFSDTEIGILLIDIVGKSIPSCLHMVTIKSVIHRNINAQNSPSEFLHTLNLELIKDPVFTKYVPVFYAKLDTKNKTFTYCNGGHEPAIWYSNQTSTLLNENNGILGMFDDAIFHDTTLQLSTGDKLILFTDGLSDLKDINAESFTETPLTSALTAYTPHPNRSLSEFIYISALTVCEKQPKDDITILTVQVI